MHRTACLAILICCLPAGRSFAGDGKAGSLSYEKHIRPILKAHCFECHGEDGKREGGLDLRLRRLIAKGGESGTAIVPGKPSESLLLGRVRDGEMPPGDDKRLPAADVAVISRWIADGAVTLREEPKEIGDGPLLTVEEREFWSFRPVRRPPIPQVRNREHVRTPIDAFLLTRLEQQGYSFADDADRVALIRRASFDLLGLPPSPADVDAFQQDRSPGAYERLIARLLASPHYGERWGRHWLDVAGYADSEGYTDADTPRPWAFRYRDYVIRAFNDDKPYDQFVREQLAGDEMLAPPYRNLSPEQIDKLAATGFLRMSPDGTGSGGIDQGVARNQVMADTLQIVTSSLLGLTVACAQCHNHRYDPISQRDYYALRAIFEPALDPKNWRTPAGRRTSLYTDADRELAKTINAQAAVVDEERSQKAAHYIDRTLEEELALLPESLRESLRTAYKTPAKKRTPQQVALLKEHPSVASISIGSLYLYDRRREAQARKIDAERAKKEKRYLAETAARELEKVPRELRPAVQAAKTARVEQRTPEQTALLNRFPGVVVTAATLHKFNPDAAAELENDAARSTRLRTEKAADDLKRYADRAAAIRAKIPREEFVRGLTEIPGKVPVTRLFHRGDHEQPKAEVPPGELTVLALATGAKLPADNPGLPTTGRRLAYARHLTTGRHPLTARVIVNRIWRHHFGRGLVESPGDFGALGRRPTHPELLDWLASEFMRGGWQLKRLHQLILTSTVYRQSSRRRGKLNTADPDNRLYGRMNLRRLESEVLRDMILAVSGRLNSKMYGDPVPVMEDEVGQIVIGKENLDGERKPTDAVDLGGEELRRSLYVQVRRSRPLAVLDTFDTPAMTPNCTQRTDSNVAPQALMLMNSRFVADYSARFAERIRSEAEADRKSRIARAWRLAFGREPDADALSWSVQFLDQQTAALRKSLKPSELSQADRFALSTFCQALLSSNAFLYVD